MTVLPKPKLPIPTGLGWLLLESLEQNSWLKKIAQIAAIGAAATGKDEDRARDAFYKVLTKASRGKMPGTNILGTFKVSLRRGGIHMLQKTLRHSQEHINHIAKHLDVATGPFTALAIGYFPPSPSVTQKNLFDYSGNIDQLGTAFAAAVEADDLEAAKRLFLGSNFLDEAYWSFPDPGMEDSHHNREAMRNAVNWDELTRASGALLLNITLSWLSCLDLAVLSSYSPVHRFPCFLPLATRFTPEGRAAMRENRPPPVEKWSDCFDLPIPNLIRMLKSIAAESASINPLRTKPPKPQDADKGAREGLSSALKEIARHDMLSITQFDNLLGKLEPKAETGLQKDEKPGFDIYALHLAANLFSLLTPRNDQVPTNGSRRKRPASITVYEDIPAIYERWWRRNLKGVTGETSESPRPAWFTRLLGETVQTDRPD